MQPILSESLSPELTQKIHQISERQKTRILARKACPIRKVGPYDWAFIHASILDYFVTLVMYDEFKKGENKVDTNLNNAPPTTTTPNTQQISNNQFLQTTHHPMIAEYEIWDEIMPQEADELFQEEGIKVTFKPNEQKKPFSLGEGNFGRLLVGRHVKTKKFAAIKEIRGEEAIKASEEEAKIQRQLNGASTINRYGNPGSLQENKSLQDDIIMPLQLYNNEIRIMPIWHSEKKLNAFRTGELLYQVMPLAGFGNGDFLQKQIHLLTDKSLRYTIIVHVLKGLLEALKTMHRYCIYHLDIKLSNIVFDIRGNLYLVDFGCSMRKYGNNQNHLIEGGCGDTTYFSPERIANWRYLDNVPRSVQEKCEKYDAAKTDCFAAGLSLLQLLLNQYPLERVSKEQKVVEWDSKVMERMLQDNVLYKNPPPEHANIIAVIRGLLQMNPAIRLDAQRALESPLFKDPNFLLTSEQLKQVFVQLKDLQAKPMHQAEIRSENSGQQQLQGKYKYLGPKQAGDFKYAFVPANLETDQNPTVMPYQFSPLYQPSHTDSSQSRNRIG